MIDVEGYKLILADYLDNIKRGGVCIYYKESFPVRVISLSYIKEALLLEMSYNSKKVIVSVICRSSSQNNDEFDTFLSNFQKLLMTLTLQGLGFFWVPMVGGGGSIRPTPLAKISENDAIHLKLGTFFL